MPARGTSRAVVALTSLLLAAAQGQKKPDITEAWDRLLEDTAIETHASVGRADARLASA